MKREPTAIEQLEALYRELDREIATLGFACNSCGKCCRFVEFGHMLYCSALEAEYLASGVELPTTIPDETCIFLVDGKCSRRSRRTFGCRTYYCVGEGTSELLETYLSKLKGLHEAMGLAWSYRNVADHLRDISRCATKGKSTGAK